MKLSFNFYLFLFGLIFSACTKVGPQAKRTAIPTDVRFNGIEMGKTDFGKFYYPYIVFYTYKDAVTQQWSTSYMQTGSGIGEFKYENVRTTNANGYISSFGYVTWSNKLIQDTGYNNESVGEVLISTTHTYSVYIQIDSYGNRTVKIEQEYN